MPPLTIILFPLFASLVSFAAGSRPGSRIRWVAVGFTAAALAVAASWAPAVLARGSLQFSYPWAPTAGIYLSLWIDGLSLFFLLLILGMGVLIAWYAAFYLADEARVHLFYGSFFLFITGMVGVVSSANLICLLIFWELTSVSSFLLIGFWGEKETARYGASKALFVTFLGGLALLAGFILIGMDSGTLEWPELLRQGYRLPGGAEGFAIFACLMIGAFTKSAQFPFHIWLPNAMAAPTPVSAYLHSATMVKAGIFLLLRLSPLLRELPYWSPVLVTVGAITLAVGAVLAVRERDLKALLAYSTVSQLGLMVALLGASEAGQVEGVIFYLIHHAVFKAGLFLIVGILDHEAGTRRWEDLGGLARQMPLTAGCSVVLGLSMAGVPLLGGFLGKEVFYEAIWAWRTGGWVWGAVAVTAVSASVLTFVYSFIFFYHTFFERPARQEPVCVHDPAAGFLFPSLLLAAATVVIGLFPNVVGPLVAMATGAASQEPTQPHFALWHGLTPALWMSAATLFLGGLLFALRARWLPAEEAPAFPFTPARLYDAFIAWSLSAGRRLTEAIMGGRLSAHMGTTLVLLVALFAVFVWKHQSWRVFPALSTPSFLESLLCLNILLATAFTLWVRTRVGVIVGLSVVGYSLALLYARLEAPDLVLTQVLVETVTTLIFVLVFYKMPPMGGEKRFRSVMDVAAPLGTGLLTAMLVLWGIGKPWFERVSSYYLEHSKILAGGNNVVNMIIVDFRGLDTLGEITVLGIAALSVISLLRLRMKDA